MAVENGVITDEYDGAVIHIDSVVGCFLQICPIRSSLCAVGFLKMTFMSVAIALLR